MNGSGMTPFAWAFMLLSMGAVTILAAYCYWRILFRGGGQELHGRPETPGGGAGGGPGPAP